jgi:methylmalonyl-CoA mutase
MILKDKAIVVIAGNPPCAEELKAKGIDNFIHVRSNLIETLMGFNNLLGIIH